MKKSFLFILVLLFTTASLKAQSSTPRQQSSPRLLLFNCHYGSGHEMATQAIAQSLPDYLIHVVDIYDDPLKPLDPFREIAPQWSNEGLYNLMAKKERNRWLNFAGKLGPFALSLQSGKVEKWLKDYIAKEQPDLIISCVPLVNPMIQAVAHKLDIPFLVVTTDIDLSAFCYGFNAKNVFQDWNRFRITVPFGQDTWAPRFLGELPIAIQDSLQYGFGYPTRRAFSEPVDDSVLNGIRKEYGIRSDEQVVLVMMGGNTGQAAVTYARLLLGMSDAQIAQIVGPGAAREKIRLICLCGDVTQWANKRLMVRLNALNHARARRNNRVFVHACPGTPQIAQLVSLPEMSTVISKPGGSTVNEMIKKKMPMVYHVSKVPLDWEKGNLDYGVSRDLGRVFETSGYLGPRSRRALTQVLTQTFALRRDIREKRRAVAEAEFDFTANLRAAVRDMLASPSKQS